MVTGARGQRLHSLKTVQFASNEFGFRNGIRQSDGTAQRVASFIEPVQFFERYAFGAISDAPKRSPKKLWLQVDVLGWLIACTIAA